MYKNYSVFIYLYDIDPGYFISNLISNITFVFHNELGKNNSISQHEYPSSHDIFILSKNMFIYCKHDICFS